MSECVQMYYFPTYIFCRNVLKAHILTLYFHSCASADRVTNHVKQKSSTMSGQSFVITETHPSEKIKNIFHKISLDDSA